MASSIDPTVPPTATVAIATALIAGLAGYFIGQASSLGIFGKGQTRTAKAPEKEDDDNSDEEDEDENRQQQQDDLWDFTGLNEECKLVLVVRTDLGMTKGKIAAQCGHATLACYKTLLRSDSAVLKQWERYGQAKVAVQAKSEEELATLQAQAMSLGICAQIVHDAGRTQIAAGSATVLGVGPAPKSVVDVVTGGLKLL